MNILILMALLHIKHHIGDYTLQTPYMLGKGKDKGWVGPLAAHAGMQAFLTLNCIGFVLAFKSFPSDVSHTDNLIIVLLAALDFVFHFIIDRTKTQYRLPAGVWAPEHKGRNLSKFYAAFGMDQLAHQLTYVLIVFLYTLLV
jgi:hypothetical protein